LSQVKVLDRRVELAISRIETAEATAERPFDVLFRRGEIGPAEYRAAQGFIHDRRSWLIRKRVARRLRHASAARLRRRRTGNDRFSMLAVEADRYQELYEGLEPGRFHLLLVLTGELPAGFMLDGVESGRKIDPVEARRALGDLVLFYDF
jgi:hypothetical protein